MSVLKLAFISGGVAINLFFFLCLKKTPHTWTLFTPLTQVRKQFLADSEAERAKSQTPEKRVCQLPALSLLIQTVFFAVSI